MRVAPLRLWHIEYKRKSYYQELNKKTILSDELVVLLECEPYKYGPDCTTQCGHCKGGDSCSMETGNCPGGCTDGWVGERCDTCMLYNLRNK